MSGENYRSTTKSHDPGWNDPPKLSFSPGTTTGQTTKLNLNKRVAFPVANSASPIDNSKASGASSLPQFIPTARVPPAAGPVGSPTTALPVGSPPLSVGTPPRATSISKAETASCCLDTYPDDNKMMNVVSTTLEEFVMKLDNSKQGEIRKRLELIQQNWSDGKLGQPLTKKLYRLAKALAGGNATEANEIHRSIIVDHGTACIQWAPALRQVVLLVPRPQESVEGDYNETEAITQPI